MLFKRAFFKPKHKSPPDLVHESAPDWSDLGYDETFYQERPRRFLNKDGSFNVLKKGRSFLQTLHLYHSLLMMSWTKFYITIFSVFVAINFIFAILFFMCGYQAIHGIDYSGSFTGLRDCFFFSVQSFTTVGYGQLFPESLSANMLATLSSLVGLLSFALATGIFFARFSRPVTMVQFSTHALMSPYKDQNAFIFRLANGRAESELLNVRIKVVMTWLENAGEQTTRRFKTLKLVRNQVAFMPAVWTIIHPVTQESPLTGKSKEQLEAADVEFLITLNAFDETFSQTVYKRSSYKWYELMWNSNFTDMISSTPNGLVEVDLSKIDQWEAA
ncbi:MAG: ion channel [Fibrobacterales bacterium]